MIAGPACSSQRYWSVQHCRCHMFDLRTASTMNGPLHLAPGVQTHLLYGTGVRRDLQLLELDESLLTELQCNG